MDPTMQQAVSDNQAKDIDGLTTDMDHAKISEGGTKEVPTYDQQFPSLGGLGAGPTGETQPFGNTFWTNKKPRVQASTITQVGRLSRNNFALLTSSLLLRFSTFQLKRERVRTSLAAIPTRN